MPFSHRFSLEIPSLLNKLTRDSVLSGLNSLSAFLFNFLFARLLLSALGIDGYAYYILALTLPIFLNQVLYGGLVSSASRYYSIAKATAQLKRFNSIYNSGRIRAGVVYAGIAVCFLIPYLLGLIDASTYTTVNALLLLSLCECQFSFSDALLSVDRNMLTLLFARTARRIVKLVSILIAIQSKYESAQSFLLFIAVGQFILCAIDIYLRNRRLKVVPVNSQTTNNELSYSSFSKYALPFTIMGVFTWVKVSSDKWILETFLGSEPLAIYAVLQQAVSSPVAQVMGICMGVAFPFLMNLYDTSLNNSAYETTSFRKSYFQCLRLTLVIAITMATLSLTISPHTVRIIDPGYIAPSLTYASALSISAALNGFTEIVIIPLYYQLQSVYLLRLKAASSLLVLALNLLCVQTFGIKGVYISSVLGAIVYLSIAIWSVRRLRGIVK